MLMREGLRMRVCAVYKGVGSSPFVSSGSSTSFIPQRSPLSSRCVCLDNSDLTLSVTAMAMVPGLEGVFNRLFRKTVEEASGLSRIPWETLLTILQTNGFRTIRKSLLTAKPGSRAWPKRALDHGSTPVSTSAKRSRARTERSIATGRRSG